MRLVGQTGEQPREGARGVDGILPIARLAGQRNQAAMRQIVHAVAPAMVRAIRKVMAHQAADVEDVLQDAVEGLLQALVSFKGECTVLHFACRIAVLSALAFRRRSTFRAQFVADAADVSEAPASQARSPLEDLHTNRRRQVLGWLLDELAPAQAEVLVLHCALGKRACNRRRSSRLMSAQPPVRSPFGSTWRTNEKRSSIFGIRVRIDSSCAPFLYRAASTRWRERRSRTSWRPQSWL